MNREIRSTLSKSGTLSLEVINTPMPEPNDGSFHFFAKNIWAILNSWLIEREVLGKETVGMDEIMIAIWEYHYPYLTENGLVLYHDVKKRIPQLVKEEKLVTA